MQFDADTVGSGAPAADAEMCMMAADTMEALGVPRGAYVVKVNNRKIFEGLREVIGVTSETQWLTVMRAIDKLDRLGIEGVRMLLGHGRKDESGDFTKGAELDSERIEEVLGLVDAFVGALKLGSNVSEVLRDKIHKALVDLDELPPLDRATLFTGLPANGNLDYEQVGAIINFLRSRFFDDRIEVSPRFDNAEEQFHTPYPWDQQRSFPSDAMAFSAWSSLVQNSKVGCAGVDELVQMANIVRAAGYGPKRIIFDSSVVRGLEYYTGPVYEVELTFETKDEHGKPVRFGSVGGGGRYDGLVGRFRSEPVPATGFSIGVSRLQAALTHLGKLDAKTRARSRRRHRLRQDPHRRLPKNGPNASQRQHPRRALSRLRQDGAAAQICRQARLAVRHHPGWRREGEGRGADQGFDRGRQGRGRDRLQSGMAREPAGTIRRPRG